MLLKGCARLLHPAIPPADVAVMSCAWCDGIPPPLFAAALPVPVEPLAQFALPLPVHAAVSAPSVVLGLLLAPTGGNLASSALKGLSARVRWQQSPPHSPL